MYWHVFYSIHCKAGPYTILAGRYLGGLDLIKKSIYGNSLTTWALSSYVFFQTPSEFWTPCVRDSEMDSSLMQITWNTWVSVKRVGSIDADKRADSLAFRDQGFVPSTWSSEDLVPVPPLQFTLFPYEAPDEFINMWWSGIPFLDRLDEDGDFEEYQ